MSVSNEGAEEVARELQGAARASQPELKFEVVPKKFDPGAPIARPRRWPRRAAYLMRAARRSLDGAGLHGPRR